MGKLSRLVEKLLNNQCEVAVKQRLQEDIAHLELNAVPLLSSSIFTKSIFCKFVSLDLRMKIWGNKVLAENNKVYLEEWLTDLRATLLKKCKALMKNPSHMSQE